MKVEQWPLDKITPYDQNPRINSDAVDPVAESIRQFGFRQPIVVDSNGVIICGHTRFKAAQTLSLDTIPVHVAMGLTPDQVRAYRLADNKVHELSEWDYELLPLELCELQSCEIDIGLIGFSEDDLNTDSDEDLNEGETDPDDIPDPPAEPITQHGDLWLLGDHRLLCGDSSLTGDVDRLIDGAPIHLVNSDPPYGVSVEPRSKNAIAAGLSSFSSSSDNEPTQLRAKDRPLKNDGVSEEEFEVMLSKWFGNIARVLLPGRAFYLWGGYANCDNYPRTLKQHRLYFSQSIIWDKQHPVLGRKDFMGAHEWCFYGWKEGAAHQFYGPNNATDLWSIKKVASQKMVHLTEKPVELSTRAIQYSSQAGENVLDLFGGSGSTLIAAEQTNRNAYLMELDPLYVDVIVQRWEEFTGRRAERVTT